MIHIRKILFLIIGGAVPVVVAGCGGKGSEPAAAPSKTPPPKISATDQKFIAAAKNMTPQEQMEFFRKNPKMAQNPAVMAKLREVTRKVVIKDAPGEKPRVNTGRPSL